MKKNYFFSILFFLLLYIESFAFQTNIEVDCELGPTNTSFCYNSNETTTYIFTSTDGSGLNISVTEGSVENIYDEFIVLDSNGDILYEGFGNSGDLSGLSFQSLGNQLTVQVQADSSISCQDNGYIPINLFISCATCLNPQANYEVVSDCENGNSQFFIETTIIDLGTANSLAISDNEGNNITGINQLGVYTLGPYPNNTVVEITIQNEDDVNCVISSDNLTQIFCPEDYLEVTDSISPEELVSDYLMNSSCSQAFNITYSTGTTYGATEYGIAYFSNSNSSFPITEGIVLSSGAFENIPGPEDGSQGFGSGNWPGDTELENEVPELESGNSYNATILEFDFVPFVEEINFNFLFASDEYGFYQCTYSDAFAFLLTDAQGNTQNLAVVPDSNDRVSVVTIRDQAYNNGCESQNIDYFDTYYGPNSVGDEGNDPLTSPTNFRGNTTVLTASSNVTIGEQYHIKLVIADRGDSILDSAVFIEAGSFDVGEINLGPDMTTTCNQESVLLDTNLPDSFVGNVEWFWNGNLITDSSGNPITTTNLEVFETGSYTVAISVGDAACASEDTIEIIFEDEILLDLPNEDTFCTGETYTIVGTPSNVSDFNNLNYQWFFNGNLIPNENSENLAVNEGGTYTVEISSDEQTGCPPLTESIQLEMIDFEVSFSAVTNICFEENEVNSFELTPQINGIPPENNNEVTYLWDSGEVTPSLQVYASGTYQVTVFYKGCERMAFTEIKFGTAPELAPILDKTICPDFNISYSAQVLNASNYSSIIYQWYNAQNNLIANTQQLTLTEGGNYTLIVSAENSEGVICETSEEFSLTQKDVQLSLPEDQILCAEESFTITPTISGQDVVNPTYVWQDATGTVLANTEQITVNTDGIYTLKLYTSDCAVEESVAVNFFSVAELNLGENIVTCDFQVDLPVLDATPSNLNTSEVIFKWTYNGVLLQGETSATLNSSLYGYGDYEVEVQVNATGQNCENTIDTISISKEQEIEVSLISNDINNIYCIGETVEIIAGITGNVNLETLLYVWYENGILMSGETGSSISFEISSSLPSPSIYEVVVGEGDCKASAVIEIATYNNEDCIITEGLSPSTSIGMNDKLDLKFLNDRSGIKNIKIFNRYGTLVFEKSNYIDSFHGQDKNGNLLVTGTYFYIIELEREDSVFGNLIKDWIYINQSTK